MSDTQTMAKHFGDAHYETRSKVWFDFSPAGNGMYAVEKDEGGIKRRYLYGTSSGPDKDGHGENMTLECIRGFQEQAQRGDVLLFVGKHDVSFVDDVGILTNSYIDKKGDWWTEYRLYDSLDGLGEGTLEKADKAWRQVNGLPPYTTPKQYGFSIEGDIPDGGIARMDAYGRRSMNAVDLAGVVLVRKPAYRTSIAYAVSKALDFQVQREAEDGDRFYSSYYELQDNLDRSLKKAMNVPDDTKQQRINEALDDFKTRMIELCLQNPGVFRDDGDELEALDPSQIYTIGNTDALQALREKVAMVSDELKRYAARRKEEAHDAKKQHDSPFGDPQ